MNKKVLIDRITENVDLKKKDVKSVVENCFDEIIAALKKEGKVHLVGFGSFELRERPEREGRSPITHEKIIIPASKYVGFKAGSKLKGTVRG